MRALAGNVGAPSRAASTVLAAFALLAAVDACAIAVSAPAAGVAVRAARHAYDAAETLGVGAVFAVVLGVFVRFVRLPWIALVGVALAAAVAVVYRVMDRFLAIFAQHVLDGRFATAIYVALIAAFSVGLVAGPIVAARAARHRVLRFVPVPLAIAVLTIDQVVWRDDYVDAHGMVALVAALVGGAALAPYVERAGEVLARRLAGRVAIAGLAVFALFGVLQPPPDAIRFELFRQPCAVAPWILATIEWREPDVHAPVLLPPSPWLEDRASAPAIAPPLLPPDAVVVLLTIDALRADVVADSRNDARFPTLAKLKREGVVFAHASAPGAQTETSMATVFSGRYFSELRWTNSGSGWTFHPHPTSDSSVRFPELLSARGVTTANYAGIAFLDADYGITRGFREEARTRYRKASEPAFSLIGALTDRLNRAGPGPLFLCTHLTESHAPYGPRTSGDSDYARYLAAVALLDAQLARVLDVLQAKLGTRWALFVSADHGEAFGEHQTFEHGKTLYEELLHVPLLARSPLFPARTIDARVGLVDLAPTILDLFGVATPATFDGQSLVPFLAGGTVTLTRPLIAEGRLRRSLTEPDGFKVIDDPRRKVVEAYDLVADPGETRNVFDAEPARADVALAELRAFFAVHTWREAGYEPPYKP